MSEQEKPTATWSGTGDPVPAAFLSAAGINRYVAEHEALRAERDAALRQRDEAVAVLREISMAREHWMSGVGSYAGGETFAGFARRLQDIARSALDRLGDGAPGVARPPEAGA